MLDDVVLDGAYFLRGSAASLANFMDIVETYSSDNVKFTSMSVCLGMGIFLGVVIGYKYFHSNNEYVQIP